MNKKKTITLVCIFCLIVVLVGIGYLYYKKSITNNPKLIFTKVIDNFATSVKETINESMDLITNPKSSDYNVSFNLTSSNADIKNVASIINKIQINANTEVDYNKKIINLKTNVIYNNSSLINANTYFNNNTMYFEVPELYNKAIRFQDDTLNEVWQIYNKKDITIIINELVSIIKNNLKDEYFSKVEEEELTNYILSLSNKDLYYLSLNILTSMSENDSILSSLANLTNMNKENIKNDILNEKQSITENSFTNLKVTISIDKTIEIKRIIIASENDSLELIKNNHKYDIIIFTDGESNTIGSIEANDNLFNININYDRLKLDYNIKNSNNTFNMTFNGEFEGNIIRIIVDGDNSAGKTKITIKDADNYINLLINLDYKIKEVNNIEAKSITNYTDIDKITEQNLASIEKNLANNENLLQLMQDILSISGTNLERVGNQEI